MILMMMMLLSKLSKENFMSNSFQTFDKNCQIIVHASSSSSVAEEE